jgi:hypothetical protein
VEDQLRLPGVAVAPLMGFLSCRSMRTADLLIRKPVGVCACVSVVVGMQTLRMNIFDKCFSDILRGKPLEIACSSMKSIFSTLVMKFSWFS